MSEKTKPEQPAQAPTSHISQIFGLTRLLPSESEAVYRAGLIGTINELGATTHLQTYIAEKIFQCMWWMRRYETQKQLAIINSMVQKLVKSDTSTGNFFPFVGFVNSDLYFNFGNTLKNS